MNPTRPRGLISAVATVAGGAAGAQALTLLATPLLTRTFGPDQFGVLGTFVAVAGILGAIAALRLDLAIAVPADERSALDVATAGLVATAGMSLVAFAATLALALTVSGALPTSWTGIALGLLPATIAATGVFQVANQVLARASRYQAMATSQLLRSGAANGWPLLARWPASDAGALILGAVLGQLAAVARALTATRVVHPGWLGAPRRWTDVATQFRSHRAFTVFGSAQALTNALNQAVPVLMLAALFDATSVGYYVLAQRLLVAPVNLVGQSLRQVLYPRLGAAMATGNALQLGTRVTLALAALAVPGIVVVALAGPSAFAWLLGSEWRTAGTFAAYLALWFGSGLLSVPAVSMIPLLGVQRTHSALEGVYLVARVAAIAAAATFGDVHHAVLASSLVGACFNLGLIGWVLRTMRRRGLGPVG
jgi:O-antigen/teichoic acid export membrane protein